MAQSMENKVGQAADQAKNLADKAKDAAGSVGGDQARQAAANLTDQARQAASNVADTVTQFASTAAQQARDAMGNMGNMNMGDVSSSMSHALQQGQDYFQGASFDGVVDDLGAIIRRNPVPAVLVGVGVGFLLGRMMRS